MHLDNEETIILPSCSELFSPLAREGNTSGKTLHLLQPVMPILLLSALSHDPNIKR